MVYTKTYKDVYLKFWYITISNSYFENFGIAL